MSVNKALGFYDKYNMAMPYGDIVAQKYKSVYIPFSVAGLYSPALGKAMYFRPDPELDSRNCIIKGIQLICAEEGQKMIGWGQEKDNLPLALLRKGIFYVSNDKREVIATLPFHNLIKFANNGKLAMTYFTQQIWQNCYVEFTNIVGISSSNGLQFIVYYDEK